jgi:glycerol-3-phosphate dehydrogenase
MGPCQGGFCTFRAAGLVAERVAHGTLPMPASALTPASLAAVADRAMIEFVGERFRGTRPIAWGRQLQELWFTAGIYQGVLGSASLIGADGAGPAAAVADPVAVSDRAAASPASEKAVRVGLG